MKHSRKQTGAAGRWTAIARALSQATLLVALVWGIPAKAADEQPAAVVGPAAVLAMQERLDTATRRLAELRGQIADEKIPLNQALAAAEKTLGDTRREHDAIKRQADNATLEITALRNEIRQRETERNYLSSLFGEYVRNFETRLHIAELEPYRESLDEARTALERLADAPAQAFGDQLRLVLMSLARLEEMAGGLTFKGRAASEEGLVQHGNFLLFGPVAYFASDDGSLVGLASQRIGSLIPVIETHTAPAYQEMVAGLLASGAGWIPFDASLGDARRIEETRETLPERFDKGGPIMYPMLALLCCALLVAILKWLGLMIVPMPRARRLAELLDAVRNKEFERVRHLSQRLRGPVGRMVRAGCETIEQPREIIEEAMYEKMLDARFRLNRFLPFLAVTAACAPLLGLLGTVTGIISTFKLMTVFGTGDIRVLSSGISEALITTEFGLYIAIPAVLIHAFLLRKARGIGDRMEQIAIRFMGEVGRTPVAATAEPPMEGALLPGETP